jgi:hypothetical protein
MSMATFNRCRPIKKTQITEIADQTPLAAGSASFQQGSQNL